MKWIEGVVQKWQPGKRLIVGVDGLSGAGKTTLVKELARELEEQNIPYAVLHLDDLITDRSTRYNTGHEEWHEHYALQWDVPHIAKTVLASWRRGDAVLELDVYDAEQDVVNSRRMSVPAEGVLLIEGVYLQRQEWRDYYDWVLYIDCPRDIRFARVTGRGQQDIEDQERIARYRRRYWAAEDHYLTTERPLERADCVWSSAKQIENCDKMEATEGGHRRA